MSPESQAQKYLKKENNMFNALFALLVKKSSIISMSNMVSQITRLIDLFEKEFAADKNAKNAALDAVIQILQNHKEQP